MQLKKLFAVAGIFSAMLTASGSVSAGDAKSDLAAVHAADQAWQKAYNGGDLAAVLALYDAQAILYPPGSPPLQGSAAIKTYFSKDILDSAKAGVVFVLDPKPDGGVSGDIGWASGTYAVKTKAGKVLDRGWYFSVSQRKDGKWVYLRDAFNSSTPPVPAAAPAPAAPPAKTAVK
jgi:ketosteroid isomerase-like protein